MGDTPEPPRRLEWPNAPLEAGGRPPDVTDPEGRWLAEGSADSAEALPAWIALRDGRGLAPQHGAWGRLDPSHAGVFDFPDAESGERRRARLAEVVVAPEVAEPSRAVASPLFREAVETILLAILVFLCVRASVQHYRVEGQSMDPTLEDGEFLIVNSLIYREVNLEKFADWIPFWDPGEPDVRHVFHGPERGDIVILHPRQQTGQRDLVKRVIGVPGDTLEIRDGVVLIDARELIEPYIKERWQGNLAPISIPKGRFFVMGDNRNGSLDSRSFGLVEEDDIVGKAMASWWPRNKWGRAPNEEPRLAPAR